MMDQAQARALLAAERAQLQRLLQAAAGESLADELGDEVDDADRRDATQTGMAVDQLLRARWAALQRAEARLAAGSYGRSVRRGRSIPTSGWRPTRWPSRPLRRRPQPSAGPSRRPMMRSGWCWPAIPSRCSPMPTSPQRKSRPPRRTTTSLPQRRAWASISSPAARPDSPVNAPARYTAPDLSWRRTYPSPPVRPRRSGKETPRPTCRHRVESLEDSVALLTVGATGHG
jgi:DnaK suppressor protein